MTKVEKISTWLRILNVIAGIIYIVFSAFVILNSGFVVSVLIFFLAILSFFIGLIRVLNGIFDRSLSTGIRVLKIIVGVLLVLVAALVWLFPGLGIIILVIFLALGLLANGAVRVALSIMTKNFPTWQRIGLFLVGLLSMIIAAIVILFSTMDATILVLLLALGFIITGVGRIVVGLSGYELAEED